MNKINNFSPNMLKTFDECQWKFFLKYIQKLSLPQRSAIFEKGKKVHALANYYLKGENIEKMEKVLTADEKNAWESLKNNEYFKLNVVDTEYNLSCKIDKYWVGGRLDAFMSKDAKTQRCEDAKIIDNDASMPLCLYASDYCILDYKTGNIPQNPEMDFQTVVYLLCADKFLKGKGGYNTLKMVYIGLKNDVKKEILLTEDLKKQYEEKIVSTCQKINFAANSKVFSKNRESCKLCEYRKICEET